MNIINSIRILFSNDRDFAISLSNLLGFTPGNISVYHLAFRHRSAAEEHPSGIKLSNERLEYLGDAVLGAVIAEMLFKKFPYKEEGFLTEMRSRIVNRDHLNKLAMKLGIDQFMNGSIDPGAKNRSAYGDAFEALIGAVYIDKGYEKTKRLILKRIVNNHIHLDEIVGQESNFKSKLINWSQREKRNVEFEFLEEIENMGKKLLRVRVLLDGQEISRGEDFSKKRAEQIAAEKACAQIGI
ncbi:MAG: ribonuclease III [Bacteroidetes bacterium]|nr:MAG: ribonuclease III [Bacteroidota bacterium]